MPDAAAPEAPPEKPVETQLERPADPGRSKYDDIRDRMCAEADKDNMSPEQFQDLIGKADESARETLVRAGQERAPEGKKDPKPETPAKPAEPSEAEKLRAELAKAQESTQKRIDELTAKLKEAEAKDKPSKPAQKTIQDISDAELDAMWEKAEVRGYKGKDPDTGEPVEDPILNARIKRQVEAELRRRELDAREKPAKESAQLRENHAKSIQEALTKYQKHFYKPVEKDGKTVLTYDDSLPVAKRANEILAEWEKNRPHLFHDPDAPMRAAREAVDEQATGLDTEAAKLIAQLRTENESLRNRLNMDGGTPGGGAPAPSPQDQFGDTYEKNRRAEYLRRTGR